MSANIDTSVDPAKVTQLDRSAEPDVVTPEEVNDATRLARLIKRVLRDLAGLLRRWAPDRIDFEKQAVDATGTTLYSFQHDFEGTVRWWVVDWTGAAAPALSKHETTTDRTLVLVSYVAGTLTLRVEEAG